MRLNEIPNYDGSIWAYAQMAKYAREMHGPENYTKALYEGGQASILLPMIGLSGSKQLWVLVLLGWVLLTAIIGAGAALLINIAAKKRKSKQQGKKSAVSAKSQSKRLI